MDPQLRVQGSEKALFCRDRSSFLLNQKDSQYAAFGDGDIP